MSGPMMKTLIRPFVSLKYIGVVILLYSDELSAK